DHRDRFAARARDRVGNVGLVLPHAMDFFFAENVPIGSHKSVLELVREWMTSGSAQQKCLSVGRAHQNTVSSIAPRNTHRHSVVGGAEATKVASQVKRVAFLQQYELAGTGLCFLEARTDYRRSIEFAFLRDAGDGKQRQGKKSNQHRS